MSGIGFFVRGNAQSVVGHSFWTINVDGGLGRTLMAMQYAIVLCVEQGKLWGREETSHFVESLQYFSSRIAIF